MYAMSPEGVGCFLQNTHTHTAAPRCTKCNSPRINGQCTNHRVAVLLCDFYVPIKGLKIYTARNDPQVELWIDLLCAHTAEYCVLVVVDVLVWLDRMSRGFVRQ